MYRCLHICIYVYVDIDICIHLFIHVCVHIPIMATEMKFLNGNSAKAAGLRPEAPRARGPAPRARRPAPSVGPEDPNSTGAMVKSLEIGGVVL